MGSEKCHVQQRETIVSSNDSLQLRPFQNGNFSKKEFAPRGSEFFPLRAVPYGVEIHICSLECYYFYYARAFSA